MSTGHFFCLYRSALSSSSPAPSSMAEVMLAPPVRIGDVVVQNVCGSGVDVVATMEAGVGVRS